MVERQQQNEQCVGIWNLVSLCFCCVDDRVNAGWGGANAVSMHYFLQEVGVWDSRRALGKSVMQQVNHFLGSSIFAVDHENREILRSFQFQVKAQYLDKIEVISATTRSDLDLRQKPLNCGLLQHTLGLDWGCYKNALILG
eukprot:CAMPEP_0175108348 /NCGR_PEP_ID=MMETSP0086_2-20121207/12583_1 /TAXON_ID=136419 /ORGANISM="Unknown Unknown, Strain D1" /LENGTH=140 /DNA_ID=CAMNT_0016385541 /DNA_START=158 /DNA_END=580 /DNA_ORIENTATION=+